jgi:hypothetical protein
MSDISSSNGFLFNFYALETLQLHKGRTEYKAGPMYWPATLPATNGINCVCGFVRHSILPTAEMGQYGPHL